MLVRVLGPVTLQHGEARTTLGSRAVRSLLAALATHTDTRGGTHVPVDTLTAWVWGEDQPDHPQAALQTLVSRLRRTLRDTAAPAVLETVPGGYRLAVEPEQVDAVRFETLVRRARALAGAGDPSAAQVFDDALALWHGDHALVDVTPGPEADATSLRLEELRLAAVHDRIQLLLRCRRYGQVLDELALLTSRHPLREGFTRQFMIALDGSGRRADALEVYRRLDRALRDELGIGPDPVTRAVQADLLAERPINLPGLDPIDADGDGARDEDGATDETGARNARARDDAGSPDDAGPGQVGSPPTETPAEPAAPGAPTAAWPLRVGTPPALAAAFQIRPELRDRVETAQLGAETVVVTQVLAGDGGVGKTQLAADLFHDAMQADRTDLGVWVTATSRDAVLAAYAAAYQLVQPSAASARQEIEERAAAFLAWLGETDRTWMIVLDDVVDPADLNRLRPRGRTGRVLVTTRRRDAATTALGTVVDVGLFTPDESLAYLHERLRQPHLPLSVLDGAEQLTADLGNLPLALAQAAAVIINDAITCAEYRTLLADRTLGLAEVFPRDPRASGDDYAQALPAAWSLATERAAAVNPMVPAMLQLVAVLDPNGIPEAVLLAAPATEHLGRLGHTSDARRARAAVRAAHQFSLLTHAPTDPTRSVRMHSLAQRAALQHLGPDELGTVTRAAADALVACWPTVASDPDLCQVLRANTSRLRERHPDALWRPDIHEVILRAGHDLGQVGQVGKAVEYYAELVEQATVSHGADHPSTLSARFGLADFRGRAGDVVGAVHGLVDLLAARRRVLGPDHPDTLFTCYELASWRGESGDAETAARELERLAADCTRALGPDDPVTLSVRHDWAYWRAETGDHAGAVQAFEEQLPDNIRVFGADAPQTLGLRHYQAKARGLGGDAAGAVGALEALVQDAVRFLGPDTPYTLLSRGNLAPCRGEAVYLDAARAGFEALLADELRILGPDHPETLDARSSLARWRGEAGDVEGALRGHRALLADLTRLFGPEHPRTVQVRVALSAWEKRSAERGGRVIDVRTTPQRSGVPLPSDAETPARTH